MLHFKIIMPIFMFFFVFTSVSAFASEAAPDQGLERIPWAVKCAGAMPKGMSAGLVILIVVIVLTVWHGIRFKGGERDGK